MRPIACIVLPTFNEAKNVTVLLPLIFEQAKKIESHELQVLVVDDNSPDGTAEVVKGLMNSFPGLHLISGEKKGLGDAYKRGMAYAINHLKADIIFEMDADLQHDPVMIPLFVDLYRHGFNVVIGSRFLPGAEMPNISHYRKFLSLFGNWLIRFFGGLPRIRDLTSGYRCIDAKLIEKCDFRNLSTTGYSFQTSLIFELLRNGARVIEVPINFPDRKFGQSKLSFPDQLEFLINLLKIRFRESYDFVRFIIIGSIGIIVNMSFFILFTRIMKFPLEVSALLAIETSVISNFMLTNTGTFRGKKIFDRFLTKVISYHKKALSGIMANFFILLILVRIFTMYDLLANFIGIWVGIVINYLINAFLNWKE